MAYVNAITPRQTSPAERHKSAATESNTATASSSRSCKPPTGPVSSAVSRPQLPTTTRAPVGRSSLMVMTPMTRGLDAHCARKITTHTPQALPSLVVSEQTRIPVRMRRNALHALTCANVP